MYERIVVALDGSARAEQILPHVEALAQRFGSTVVLLRATAPVEPGLVGEAVLISGGALDRAAIADAPRREAADYLAGLADRLRQRGLAIGTAQSEGEPAHVIVQHLRREGADLLAMTTHGRGGLGRALFGSVAEAVLREAPCPVLLVRIHPEAGAHG
jgi:nucleotide-binding universal stress UspA family protein